MPSWVAPIVAAELWKVRWECVAAGIADGSIPTFDHCGLGFVDAACTDSQRAAHRARRKFEHANESAELPVGTKPDIAMTLNALPENGRLENVQTESAQTKTAQTENAQLESPQLQNAIPVAVATPQTLERAIATTEAVQKQPSARTVTARPKPARLSASPLSNDDDDEAGPPPLEEDRGPDIRQWRSVRRAVSRTRIPPRRVPPHQINPAYQPADHTEPPAPINMPNPGDAGLFFPPTHT